MLLHYVRTISSPLISWITLTLHQLMDPPLPGFLLWHFYIFTFQLLQVGSAYSRFRLYTTSVLLHWGWSCELFLHYTRTISLTARQFKINSEVFGNFGNCTAPALFHGVWPTSFHLSSKLHGSTRTTWQPQKTYVAVWPEATPINLPFSYYVLTWIAFAALHPYYLIAFDLVNCSCAPSTDGSVITGHDANFGDDVSRFRNWTKLQQFQFLHYNTTFVEVEFAKCFYTTSILFHCIWSRELLFHSISWWIRHYRGFCCDIFTFSHFNFSRSARLTADSGFTLHQYYFIEVDLVNCFCTTSVLFHWQLGSSRSAQGCLANLGIALHQYFCVEFVQHLFSKITEGYHGSRRRRMWEEHPFHGLLPVTWPEAKPKTSRTDYGKRPSRETSRDQIMARGQADKPPVFVSFLWFYFNRWHSVNH